MKLNYNVTGDERKRMVAVIGEVTGVKPIYTRMPECAYVIGGINVSKTGEMICEEEDQELIERITAALEKAGFTAEAVNTEVEAAEEFVSTETETTEEPVSTEEEAEAGEEPMNTPETTGLVISFPLDGGSSGEPITQTVLQNLEKIIFSKATLIKKALNAEQLIITTTEDQIQFPWWDKLPEQDLDGFSEITAYSEFLTALIRMARNAKRVTAEEREVESEKYAFRTFLLRLGFSGAEYKQTRSILLKRLSGHSAFPNQAAADAFYARQREKKAATRAAKQAESVGEQIEAAEPEQA